MDKTLMILEVSKKQDYIFSSNRLKQNAERSGHIAYVTDTAFFEEVAKDYYRKTENLVYSGGGHTVLQFADVKAARAFAACVSEAVMRRFNGLELFVKLLPYDEQKTPGQNLKALAEANEAKKARRETSFRRTSFGLEEVDDESYRPKSNRAAEPDIQCREQLPPEGWAYPTDFGELAGEDNFIAVVHADGNAMGARSLSQFTDDWASTCERLRTYSDSIQRDFEQAFMETASELMHRLTAVDSKELLPIRPVILAGDDVCFVCRGSDGLECARIFLEKLSKKCNAADKQHYAACAGVAIVHKKFPFHSAYNLADALCNNAKKYGATLDPKGGISAMDWHIEFSQLKDSLSQIREDYETQDKNRLELRPVTVLNADGTASRGLRSYHYFRSLCAGLQENADGIARGKLKQFRIALKQGETESKFFLHDKQIEELLYNPVAALQEEEHMQQLKQALASKLNAEEKGGCANSEEVQFKVKTAFTEKNDKEKSKRCLFFDAIEMIDHFVCDKEAEA